MLIRGPGHGYLTAVRSARQEADNGQPGSYQLGGWVSTENALVFIDATATPGLSATRKLCETCSRTKGFSVQWLQSIENSRSVRSEFSRIKSFGLVHRPFSRWSTTELEEYCGNLRSSLTLVEIADCAESHPTPACYRGPAVRLRCRPGNSCSPG